MVKYTYADGVIIIEYAHSDNFDYLGEPFYQSIYAIWKNKNKKLIAISVLKKMLSTKLSQQRPSKYLQIEVEEVPKEKLKPS